MGVIRPARERLYPIQTGAIGRAPRTVAPNPPRIPRRGEVPDREQLDIAHAGRAQLDTKYNGTEACVCAVCERLPIVCALRPFRWWQFWRWAW